MKFYTKERNYAKTFDAHRAVRFTLQSYFRCPALSSTELLLHRAIHIPAVWMHHAAAVRAG